MVEWDDVRLFLALVRAGSVRGAAGLAGVSHATISRRIAAFETRMGVRLFDRLPSGFNLTTAGEELLSVAEDIEYSLDGVERRLVGRDRRLAGTIRATMIDVVATHLLMPDLTAFSQQYPDTELQVVFSYESLDLTRREADVAIRFVRQAPDHLIGKRLATAFYAPYATPQYLSAHDLTDPTSASWIGYGSAGPFPKWVKRSAYPHLPAKGVFDSILLQLQAARAGMGIANLPCFLGDTDDDLARLPLGEPQSGWDLWLLRHRDTRATARLRVFSEFIGAAVGRYRPLLEGQTKG